MGHIKQLILTIATLTLTAAMVNAQDTQAKPSADSKAAPSTNSIAKPAAAKQADVASKTARFASVARTSEVYKIAIDSHSLDNATKQIGKDGAFKGTVTRIFEPRGGPVAILNFDENYRNALTAVLRKENFDKFPALTSLEKKEVVISGKFIDYQGHAEIILTNTAQIKLVE